LTKSIQIQEQRIHGP